LAVVPLPPVEGDAGRFSGIVVAEEEEEGARMAEVEEELG